MYYTPAHAEKGPPTLSDSDGISRVGLPLALLAGDVARANSKEAFN